MKTNKEVADKIVDLFQDEILEEGCPLEEVLDYAEEYKEDINGLSDSDFKEIKKLVRKALNEVKEEEEVDLEARERFEACIKENNTGTDILYEGKKLALTQDAYADTDFTRFDQPSVYRAAAIDKEGNDYRVQWEITEENAEDACDACDWTDYTVEKR